jgi:hypothetical protein
VSAIACGRPRRKRPALADRTFRAVLGIGLGLDLLAWFGVVGLATGRLSFGDRLDARLPWHSPVVAAVGLAVAVAIPMSILALLAAAQDRRTAAASVAGGSLLTGWIGLQLIVLRELSPLQPLCAVLGLWLIALGLHLRAGSRAGARGGAFRPGGRDLRPY